VADRHHLHWLRRPPSQRGSQVEIVLVQRLAAGAAGPEVEDDLHRVRSAPATRSAGSAAEPRAATVATSGSSDAFAPFEQAQRIVPVRPDASQVVGVRATPWRFRSNVTGLERLGSGSQ
jgi:hypothetical protein